ncbi:hypothetical protein RD110_17400 [Rhodoferax koreense]|uniref:PGAP1-like protein n=2 Tax=Rhodoferax koreensis TaxID=1842727 RepID=A0A1P8JYK0_9BURK|nr:hypothetical protein RD110_17400 [Rhodoferax koreense]
MATNEETLNEHGNHAGQFTQSVGGWAEYTVWLTPTADKVIHDLPVPPKKVIPIVFLPGVMGSNLRMTKKRQKELDRKDDKAWKADDIGPFETAVFSAGYGGWFREATPAQRQLNFDPEETEVDIYKYTENQGRFDPDGLLTKQSDAQHQNVRNSLAPIPPLLTTAQKPPEDADALTKDRAVESAAQKARWRGWSEILFDGSYGEILKKIERQLNNMIVDHKLADNWKEKPPEPPKDGESSVQPPPDPLLILGKNPKDFGALFGSEPITEADLRKIAQCWYPVHAMGYNWLQSNGVSGKKIAERIKGLIKGYVERGFDCKKVIIVTHSMGGLVARAVVHPDYGNLQDSILGVYHSVMPTLGAATAYKRLRFGFREDERPILSFADRVMSEVLAPNGEHATAILANAPGPLELLPAKAYGEKWLRVVDPAGVELASWPDMRTDAPQTPVEAIYTQPADAWWRLINPKWVNPGNPLKIKFIDAVDKAYKRLKAAYKFSNTIEKTFHPNTYASWCASSNRKCYGTVVFRVIAGLETDNGTPLPAASTWTLLTDDGLKTLTVQAGSRVLTLQRQHAAEAGDETVPSERSARHIVSDNCFEHGIDKSGYEHQNSYADGQVAASTLYAIVQIAKNDKWD